MNDIKNVILSLCFLLTGCAVPFEAVNHTVDPAFYPYLMEYQADKASYLGNSNVLPMDIVFYTVSPLKNADCTTRSDGYRKIRIDPYIWFNSSDIQRLILLYHELGHCDLNLDHTSQNTIMHPSLVISDLDFNNNRSYYLNELFRKGQ